MTLRLTYEELIALNPCSASSRKALWGRRKYLTAAQALAAGASIDDLLWVASRLEQKDLCVRFALACAQRVAYLNPDPRVQAALDATQAWLDAPSDAARAAAWAARDAARAAAWDDARDAAWAARAAAGVAAGDAWVATRDAAWVAARDAAWAARAAAWDDAAEQKAQRRLFLKIFG